MSAENKKKLVITLDGGLIQDIQGIPEDLVILVRDYDVEGADEAEITMDEHGEPYFESIWEKDEQPEV